ncbi:hypothetical protein Ddc_18128 [Ditylenchus destructor]|nr:hypothetical protein Ddc_18128 [Ditylenchus destructor]
MEADVESRDSHIRSAIHPSKQKSSLKTMLDFAGTKRTFKRNYCSQPWWGNSMNSKDGFIEVHRIYFESNPLGTKQFLNDILLYGIYFAAKNVSKVENLRWWASRAGSQEQSCFSNPYKQLLPCSHHARFTPVQNLDIQKRQKCHIWASKFRAGGHFARGSQEQSCFSHFYKQLLPWDLYAKCAPVQDLDLQNSQKRHI